MPKKEFIGKVQEVNLKKQKTAESFGYEWQKFSGMIKEWKKNFEFYFEPLGELDLLKDRTILDVGCGKGRCAFYAAEIAKEVIAVDFSKAIDVAFCNNKNNTNTHFIQADICSLPFKENCFDFIYSLGVLHHLPTPEEGFSSLLKFLKRGGNILIYVYRSFPKNSFNFYALKFVNFFRSITTKLPHRVLYFFAIRLHGSHILFLFFRIKFLSNRGGAVGP